MAEFQIKIRSYILNLTLTVRAREKGLDMSDLEVSVLTFSPLNLEAQFRNISDNLVSRPFSHLRYKITRLHAILRNEHETIRIIFSIKVI